MKRAKNFQPTSDHLSTDVAFTVYGLPVPQGSMKAFTPPGFNRPIVTSDNTKLKPWRQEIAGVAMDTMGRLKLSCAGRAVPIRLELDFYFHRPQSLKKSIIHKTTLPDLDKLVRAVCDALTGHVFEDDSQIVDLHARKHFDSVARVDVTVIEIAGEMPIRTTVPFTDKQLPF